MPDPNVKVTLSAEDTATKTVRNFADEAKKSGEKVKVGLVAPLLKAQAVIKGVELAAKAAIRAVKSITTEFDKSGDELNKMSERLGLSVEQLSLMKAQAELASVSFETLTIGARQLSKNLEDFRRGSGEAKVALEELGFSADQFQGKDLQGSLELIADRFATMPDGPRKTAAAMRIFGEAGVQLIPLLNQGSEALREQREEIEALGGIMTTEQAQAATAFEDAMTRLDIAARGLTTTIGAAVVPIITSLIDKFLEFFRRVREPLLTFIKVVPELFERLFGRVREIFEYGLDADIVQDSIDSILAILDGFSVAVSTVAVGIWDPLFDALVATGIKIAEKTAEILNEAIRGFNELLARGKEAVGLLDEGTVASLNATRDAIEGARGGLVNLEAELRQLEAAQERGANVDRKRLEALPGIIDAQRDGIHQLQMNLSELEAEVGGIPQIIFPPELSDVGKQRADDAAQGFIDTFDAAFEGFRDRAGRAPNILETAFGLSQGELEQLWKEKSAEVRDGAEQITKSFQEGLQAGAPDMPEAEGGDKKPKTFFEGLVAGFEDASAKLRDFGEQGKRLAQDFTNVMGSALDQGFLKLIESGFKDAKEAWQSFVGSVLQGIQRIIAQKLTEAAIGAGLGAFGLAKGGVISAPMVATVPVHRFQHGGVVREPTMALFGEGTSAGGEAFVPLGGDRKIPVKFEDGEVGSQKTDVNLNIMAADARSMSDLYARDEQTLINLIAKAIQTGGNLRRQIETVAGRR